MVRKQSIRVYDLDGQKRTNFNKRVHNANKSCCRKLLATGFRYLQISVVDNNKESLVTVL